MYCIYTFKWKSSKSHSETQLNVELDGGRTFQCLPENNIVCFNQNRNIIERWVAAVTAHIKKDLIAGNESQMRDLKLLFVNITPILSHFKKKNYR